MWPNYVQSLPPPGFSPGLAAFLSVQKSNTYPASIPNILPRIYIYSHSLTPFSLIHVQPPGTGFNLRGQRPR